MRAYRGLAVGFTLIGLLVMSALSAPDDRPKGTPRIEPGTVDVRLILGEGDASPRSWDGKASVDRGEVLRIEGYRFRAGDLVHGRDSWKARSHVVRKAVAKAKAALNKEQGGPSTYGASTVPNGVVVTLKAPDDATLSVETERGAFAVKLVDLASGAPRSYLNGQASAQRVPRVTPVVDGPGQQDFPAAVSDGQGGLWIAYVDHSPRGAELSEALTKTPKTFAAFKPEGGGDQVKLAHVDSSGAVLALLDVTAPGRDVSRPAVARDGQNHVAVVWSENRNGNFDLYSRLYTPQKQEFSAETQLTTNPGADADVSLAVSQTGAVWMAWQSWENGRAFIRVGTAYGEFQRSDSIASPRGNAWSPSLAIDGEGKIAVAYDTYEAGNYDVRLTRFDGQGQHPTTVIVANSARYEARPTIALDPKGRVWIAYEERGANWGKDAENLVKGKGSTLYSRAAVKVKCVDGERVLDVADPLADAPDDLKAMNSFPRIACDDAGRVSLAFRHRQEAIWGNQAVMVVGGVWVEFLTVLSGRSWTPPQPLPRSDGLLDNRPALVPQKDAPPLIVYNTDGRLHREVEFTPELAWKYYSHSGTPPGVVDNDVFVASLAVPARWEASEPSAVQAVPQELAPPVVHENEPADVARMRTYRLVAGGKTYGLYRGDFHRHTEISQDGGGDGALEDMWRYAIDAAAFDWMGDADHDNGGGKEYTWWLVQKTTDLYHSPKLATLFTYERSVSYPHGHRNVMFPTRGVRTLPRLVEDGQVVDADTAMLYGYLKEHGGICASHTSATGMGTDWRDVNPTFEPLVEIYQGHRNSYEHLGAPRVARRPGEAIGGWKPLGMVWNALASQYRLGFQASSDHISTHISYAVAVADEGTREAVFQAFQHRHCYGATDNIVLDVRSGDHLMGDEFTASAGKPVALQVLVHGTRPIARVDVIKDFRYVFSTEPNKPRVEFEWTDNETRGPGLSWYYVRATQDDGELAWASPLWIQFPTARTEGR